jgi:hypothetical protein
MWRKLLRAPKQRTRTHALHFETIGGLREHVPSALMKITYPEIFLL